VLEKGERGTVIYSEDYKGEVYLVVVKMDVVHLGLTPWCNQAHLVHPELDAIEIVPSSDKTRVAMVALGVLTAIVGLWKKGKRNGVT
ncbi:MAG: hypothetical protein ACYDBH_23095, partial [Acidobacteriaceae bacterium]